MGLKGMVLTLDAIIALLLMISVVSMLTFFRIESSSPFFSSQQMHSLSEDSLSILSRSTLSEVITNRSIIDDYVSRGILTPDDLNKTAIDVIGALWSANNLSEAAALSKDILGNILPSNIGYEIIINESEVYNSSDTQRPPYTGSAAEISSGRIASGYDLKLVSGFVARAFLTSIKSKKDSSYAYFGGYVGDGNITVNVTIPPYDRITEAYMEMNAGSNFTLYINGNNAGSYVNGTAGGGLMRADKWVVCNTTYNAAYCSDFLAGNNTVAFNFSGGGSFIGGGYFRATFNTTQMAPEQGAGSDTYWFPGIVGLFNLYDSFYVPGTLTSMSAYLHYINNITLDQTNASIYLSIGSNKVFRSNKTGEQKIFLNYSDLWKNFSSAQNLIGNVSNRTVPIRFGIEGFESQGGGVGVADAVLVTDLSGSMDTNDVQPGNQDRLSVAKTVDNLFVDTVLNTSGDRVGLSAYGSSMRSWYNLTNNSGALHTQINGYSSTGSTCTSCGINNATKTLTNWSSASRFKGILVMSDGYANQCLLGDNCGIYGTSDGSTQSDDPNYPAKSEAINMSCVARSKNYTVFTVGFGSDADNVTLQRIACWNCTSCSIGLDCSQIYAQASCQSHLDCSWDPIVNNTVFNAAFEGWNATTNCSGSSAEGWNDCKVSDRGAYWRATLGSGSYNASSTRYLEASNITTGNSTWLTKCMNLTPYSKAYVTFWYNKTATLPVNNTVFNAAFEGWNATTNCSGSSAEGWNDCKVSDRGAYWRATLGSGSYNASSTRYLEASNITTGNSTWLTKCMNLTPYSKAYVTFWYNKTATSSPSNYTIFDATFDGWSTSSNCNGWVAEGWGDCSMTDSDGGVWRASTAGTRLNSSSTQHLRGSDIDDSGTAYVTKCLNMIPYSRAYLKFDWSITGLDSGEYILIRSNRTGSPSLTDLWNSGTGSSSWSNEEVDVTDEISSNTCFRVYCWKANSASEYCDLDDFKIIGTNGTEEKQFVLANETGGGALASIWSSSTSATPWTYQELNITNYISSKTCVRYMVGTVSTSNKKMLLDDFNVIGTVEGMDRKQFVLANETGGGALASIWSSSTSATPWTYQELNITNYISSKTCVRYMVGTASSVNEKMLLDDFRIMGTTGGCDNNFSSNSPCWIGNVTLPNGTQADCRAARYGQSNNVDQLKSIYGGFGSMFAVLGYNTQKINLTGSLNYSNILFSDSRISLQYSPTVVPYDYGEISVTRESPRFGTLTGNTVDKPYKEGWFNVSNQVKVVDAKIASYSSDFWTDALWQNSSATRGWRNVFNLSYYGSDYTPLGDPFIVNIPVSNITAGNNSIRIQTGINLVNKTGGSPDDSVIYTIRVKGSVGYGEVMNTSALAIADAYQRLLNLISGYVDVNRDDIQVENNSMSGVPRMWGSESIRIKVWE